MAEKENKELVIIPEVKTEPNQKEITDNFIQLFQLIKTILLISIVMLIITLVSGIIS